MRLKIYIAGRLFRHPGKNWSGDESAVVKLGFASVRIVEHHQTDKLRMVRRQITSERNNIFSLLVSPSRINLLRGSGFARNRKTGNSSGGSGTAIAYHTAQGVADFSCGFRRNHLPQLYRGK